MTRSGGLAAALLWSVIGAPAAAQTLGQGQDAGIPWLRLGAALVICLILAVGAVLVQRRRLGQPVPAADFWRSFTTAKGSESRVTAIETRRVSAGVTVSVFKCDGRDYMIAASAQGQLVLVSLDPTPEGADAPD